MKRIIFMLTIMAVTFVLLSQAMADLNDGLVTYYPFNGNANDEGENGNDGTVYGATLVKDRFGRDNSAYSFDGIDDYIKASANNLPTRERTVSLWFFARNNGRFVQLGYGGGLCGTSWFMGINLGGDPQFQMSSHCNVNEIRYYYTQPPVGNWYHFVVSTDRNGTKIYIDGVEKASNGHFVTNTNIVNSDESKLERIATSSSFKDLSIGVNVSPFGIAPYTDGNVGYHDGMIDDVRIYNRALSETEIQELYRGNIKNPIAEIIGTWSDGIFYFYPPYWNSGQSRMNADTPDGDSPSGDIEAGDTNSDGYADVASCWSTGLYLQNGRTRSWEFLYSETPYKVTMANVTGDARKEVIGTFSSGVRYFYRDGSGWSWRQITAYPPAGDITAGDITGDGWDEVVSGYSTGTWYWNPRTGGWYQLTSATYIPYSLACGDRNGDGRAEVVGTFHTGIWSWDRGRWSRLTDSGFATTGDMEMGDFNNNGRDDLVSCWPDGMWIQYDNGSWYKAYNIAPYRVTAGNIVGN